MYERLLTPAEVAEYLRISRRTVVRWVREGRLRAVRVGRQWRIPAEEVQRVVQKGLHVRAQGGGER